MHPRCVGAISVDLLEEKRYVFHYTGSIVASETEIKCAGKYGQQETGQIRDSFSCELVRDSIRKA